MSGYGHFSGFVCLLFIVLFCYFMYCTAAKSIHLLAPLHFHFVRISFSFPAVSHYMHNFFLQSACADGIKKRVVDAVTVDNDFWSCFY